MHAIVYHVNQERKEIYEVKHFTYCTRMDASQTTKTLFRYFITKFGGGNCDGFSADSLYWSPTHWMEPTTSESMITIFLRNIQMVSSLLNLANSEDKMWIQFYISCPTKQHKTLPFTRLNQALPFLYTRNTSTSLYCQWRIELLF